MFPPMFCTQMNSRLRGNGFDYSWYPAIASEVAKNQQPDRQREGMLVTYAHRSFKQFSFFIYQFFLYKRPASSPMPECMPMTTCKPMRAPTPKAKEVHPNTLEAKFVSTCLSKLLDSNLLLRCPLRRPRLVSQVLPMQRRILQSGSEHRTL